MNTSLRFRLPRAFVICAITILITAPLALYSAGEQPAATASADASLSGKTVVLAGRLPALTAAEATSLIEKAGGTVATRVTRTTDYLVAGARPGAKLEEARSLGVRVIDGAELRQMLGIPMDAPAEKRRK
jgi:DNA ligase (NAD+)